MTSHGVNGGVPVTKSRSIAIPSFRMISERIAGEFAGAFFRRPITLGREFTGEFTRDRFDRLASLEYREKQRKGGEKEIEKEREGLERPRLDTKDLD